MHDALYIPELVNVICEFTSTFDSAQCTPTLAALARTHTTFRDPALDLLWRQMSSLLPLLQCFPPDLWTISKVGLQISFRLVRPIQPSDWDRISLYAPRIKEIMLDETGVHLPSDFADALHLAFNGRHMLPNLEKMVWQVGYFPFRHARALLGPVATKVGLTIHSPQHVASLVDSLVGREPPLTEVAVSGWGAASFESQILVHMHHLRRLTMSLFETATIHHLATLQHLEALSLATRRPTPGPEMRIIPAAFPSLRSLALQAATTAWAEFIVGMFHQCALNNLHLIFTERKPLAAHAALNTLLTQRCVLSALTSFRAGYSDFDTPPPPDVVVGAETFRPLYAFTNLRTVVVHSSRIDLTDAELRELATAWPRIECLTLGSKHNFIPAAPPLLTLASLAILAECCPALVDLGLELDARVVPALPVGQMGGQTRLKQFHAHRSAIEGWPAVAVYVGRLFPEIREIKATSPTAGGHVRVRGQEREKEDKRYQSWLSVIAVILRAREDGRDLEVATPEEPGLESCR